MDRQAAAYEVTATRKRPQDFDRLVGQDFVVSTLENAIEAGRIAHAYLFSGPRGVGKTSSARLLAKALNCEKGMSAHPCGVCDSCREIAKGTSVDVIEIDGASNTSVNDVRNIKEELLFPPQGSRYKIYIIDEVHMLSTSAFNALLKTIEEPPEYAVFIFATTELQKVPATIRSRCQQFRFQLIGQDLIMQCLRSAADDLSIKADEDALFWIAKEATGSMRDAYTLFDQVASFSQGHITLSLIREKLSVAGYSAISSIVSDMIAGRTQEGMEALSKLFDQGISAEQISKDGAEFFRTVLLYKEGIRRPDILGYAVEDIPESAASLTREQLEAALRAFLSLYRNLRYSLSPRFEIELLFSRLSSLPSLVTQEDLVRRMEDLKDGIMQGRVVVKETVPRQVIVTERREEKAMPQKAEEAPQAPEKETEPEKAFKTPDPVEPEAPEEEKPVLSMETLPLVQEALKAMGKPGLSRWLMSVEGVKLCEDGEYELSVSKMLAYNGLKNDLKAIGSAASTALSDTVTVRLRYTGSTAAPAGDDSAFSPEMRKLRNYFGGRLVKKEVSVRKSDEALAMEDMNDNE